MFIPYCEALTPVGLKLVDLYAGNSSGRYWVWLTNLHVDGLVDYLDLNGAD